MKQQPKKSNIYDAWRFCFVCMLFQVQEESKWSDYARERYNTSEAKNSHL